MIGTSFFYCLSLSGVKQFSIALFFYRDCKSRNPKFLKNSNSGFSAKDQLRKFAKK